MRKLKEKKEFKKMQKKKIQIMRASRRDDDERRNSVQLPAKSVHSNGDYNIDIQVNECVPAAVDPEAEYIRYLMTLNNDLAKKTEEERMKEWGLERSKRLTEGSNDSSLSAKVVSSATWSSVSSDDTHAPSSFTPSSKTSTTAFNSSSIQGKEAIPDFDEIDDFLNEHWAFKPSKHDDLSD